MTDMSSFYRELLDMLGDALGVSMVIAIVLSMALSTVDGCQESQSEVGGKVDSNDK